MPFKFAGNISANQKNAAKIRMKCSLSDRTDRKNCLGKHEKSIRNIKNISIGDREVKNPQRVWNDDNFRFRGICKIWISRTNATHDNTNLNKTK